MVAFFFPPMHSRSRSAVYLGYREDAGATNSFSISSFNLGSAAPGRRIFLSLHWESGSFDVTLNTVTIGGNAATIHAQRHHTGGSTGLGVAIASLVVASGTSATVAGTFSSVVGNVAIGGVSAIGMARSTPFDTATDENQSVTADLTASINVDANGIVIAAMTGSTNASGDPVTWTGVNEQYDGETVGGASDAVRASMAFQASLSAQTGRTIQASVSPTFNAGNDLAVVSWS